MSLNGYDISDNQGDINNGLVPGDFVIIKATEGVGWTDPDCDANYQQAKHAGKLLGVYHFARPDGNGPEQEADYFVSQTQGYHNEAVLVLDWETEPKGNVQWAKNWLDRVFEKTGIRPWIYMSQSVANEHDWSSVLTEYSLWVAAYGSNIQHNGYAPSENISVNGDWNIAAWQYTSNGFLPNWGQRLDLNVFFGDATAWKKYAGKVPEQAPAPTIPTPEPAPTPAPVIPVTPPADTTPATPTVPAPTPVPVPAPTEDSLPSTPAVDPAPEPAPTPLKVHLTLAATIVAFVVNIILGVLKALNIL